MIRLDGCFLKHFCKNELLTAVGRDENNQMFPITWAIVEIESYDSWHGSYDSLSEILELRVQMMENDGQSYQTNKRDWFLQSRIFFLEQSTEIVLGIYMSTFEKYTAELAKLKKLFWEVAKGSIKEEFARTMTKVKSVSKDAHVWLMNQDPHLQSRGFFETHSKRANVENIMSETFNSYINEAREKPIINMLEDIRVALMIRVKKKLKILGKNPRDPICPVVKNKLEKHKKEYRFWTYSHNGDNKFEVKNENNGYIVDMIVLTCSCRMWQLSGIHCPHAKA